MEKSLKGRGAQNNPHNRFLSQQRTIAHWEGIDDLPDPDPGTEIFTDHPKQIVNKVLSRDLPFLYSINPYQGCEHGCAYCYARPAHEYWGFSAGLDFERKIVIKPDAPRLLEQFFMKKKYEPAPISVSGNTDCYQPLERRYAITRGLLEVFLRFRHPVGIITKNALILRDADLLQQMAAMNLVRVYISLTTLNEELRRNMEPRTSSSQNRLKTIQQLSQLGIPTGVMVAPIIPGLNSDEVPAIIEAAAEHGALSAGYTLVRLNGAVKDVFHQWLNRHYPDAADKVWNLIRETHGGDVSDYRSGIRMKGEGVLATSIQQMFRLFSKRCFKGETIPELNYSLFRRPGQLSLF
jgi:DNA repair photolyase